jgi:hypothetical protein
MPGTAGLFYFHAKRRKKIMLNSSRVAVQYPGGDGCNCVANVKAGKCRSTLKPRITVEQLHYVILHALVVQTA